MKGKNLLKRLENKQVGNRKNPLKPYLIQTLKELALLGAVHNKIELSSHELAEQLHTSQQTASRYLLELGHPGDDHKGTRGKKAADPNYE